MKNSTSRKAVKTTNGTTEIVAPTKLETYQSTLRTIKELYSGLNTSKSLLKIKDQTGLFKVTGIRIVGGMTFLGLKEVDSSSRFPIRLEITSDTLIEEVI